MSDLKHLHFKPAAHFLHNVQGKVGILFHKDGDGACSAAQIINYLRSRGMTPELFCGDYEEAVVSPFVNAKFDYYIILDMATDLLRNWFGPIEGKNVLIIDHHIAKDLSSLGYVHLNPRFVNPEQYISAAEIVGELFEYMNLSGKPWVAELGGVCDRSIPIKKASEEQQQASDIIDSVRAIQKEDGIIKLAKFLADTPNLERFLLEDRFQKSHEQLWNEVDRQISEYELQAVGDINFFELRGNFSLTSILVNRLFEIYPNRTIIIYRETPHGYKFSGRSNKYNLNIAFNNATKGLGNGGGHPKASGGKVSDFAKTRKRILAEFKKQDK
jgi:single-stranded DNA-specific DHH superfamily exonuclease